MLTGSLVGVSLVRSSLEVLDFALCLFDITLGDGELVLEGRDLLVLFEQHLVALRWFQL